jgi:copper chaperone NosL
MKNFTSPICILFAILFFASCSPTPEVIQIGHDECSYCKMIISEKPFATQLLTTKGKSFKFDSIECMVAYEIKFHPEGDNIHSKWVNDFENPDESFELENAAIVFSQNVKSPMGLSLLAVPNTNSPTFMNSVDGRVLTWQETKNYVKKEWRVE